MDLSGGGEVGGREEGKKGRRWDEEEGLFMSGITMPLGEP